MAAERAKENREILNQTYKDTKDLIGMFNSPEADTLCRKIALSGLMDENIRKYKEQKLSDSGNNSYDEKHNDVMLQAEAIIKAVKILKAKS